MVQLSAAPSSMMMLTSMKVLRSGGSNSSSYGHPQSVLTAALQQGPFSTSSWRLPLCHRHRRLASSKAGQLLSAAQVSSADADLNPPPIPQSPSTWAIPRPPVDDLNGPPLVPDGPHQSAKQRRLSPMGFASVWHLGGPSTLPPNLREAMAGMISGADSRLLRSDVKLTLSSESEGPEARKRGQQSRAALLHLATASPQRYATLHQVFKTTAQRLARPLPYSGGKVEETPGWAPKRVVEIGCALGEGAWAATEVWPGLQQWSGNDNRSHLLAAGEELVSLDGRSDDPSLLSQLRKERASSIEFESNKSHGMRYQRPSSDRGSEAESDVKETLTVSSYQLLSLSSDSAREHHVRSLWNSGAEAIVLIEEGTERGFAAIASARALLIELGEEDRLNIIPTPGGPLNEENGEVREKLTLGGVDFIEEKPSDSHSTISHDAVTGTPGRGCYVVAPCPHDRPCPILHPFMLDLDHETAADVAKRPGPSNHHRASGVGLDACLHPVRYLPPQWARDLGSEERRRTKQRGGREERSARMAYLVVKRGERPTMESLRRTSSAKSAQLEAAVRSARQGPIEVMRKGDSLPRRFPEDVIDVDIKGEDGLADLREGLAPEGELFKSLPAELRQAISSSQVEDFTTEEPGPSREHKLAEQAAVMALVGQGTNTVAEDVWRGSADAASTAAEEQTEVQESGSNAGSEPNEEWLSALLAAHEARTDESTVGEGENTSDAGDVSSAVSLLLPSLPRIVLPPIKKGGHVTFDACHPNGSIQRYTISKAAGKQTYHEVRKSSWADQWSQDPVEMAVPSGQTLVDGPEHLADSDGLSILETRDEVTGRRKWLKRRGWGQWSRVAPAHPAAGMAMDGTGIPFKSPSSSSPRSTRASDRPSAYIGADQVCPITPPSKTKGAKKSPALSEATTSAAAGQRPRSRKAVKAFAAGKESKRKRSMASYHDEVAAAFETMDL